MSIQYSRGCPYDCEFCDVVLLNGHNPRTKNKQHLINELESLYNFGWRSGVFIVDDNFIGNKNKLKKEILPAIADWSKDKEFPFTFYTQASINMADDDELMKFMSAAGFNRVFIGIETPNESSLDECNKFPNKGRELLASVNKIQNFGFEVQGGFIIGFDSDPVSIFQSQIDFIQKSGVVIAMVGLLGALRGTKLYNRLKEENRLLKEWSGDNVSYYLNYVPKMDYMTLMNGYKSVLGTIYSNRFFYERIWTFFKEYHPLQSVRIPKLELSQIIGLTGFIKTFFKAMWVLGIVEHERKFFWKLLILTTFRYPRFIILMLNLSIHGLHFRKLVDRFPNVPPKIDYV